MKLIPSPDLHGTICGFWGSRATCPGGWLQSATQAVGRWGEVDANVPERYRSGQEPTEAVAVLFQEIEIREIWVGERWKLTIWKMWMWSTWKDVVPRKLTLWLRVMAVCLLFLLPLSLPKSTETDSWKGWTKSIQPMASRLTRWAQPGSVHIAIRCRIDGILWTCLNMSEHVWMLNGELWICQSRRVSAVF